MTRHQPRNTGSKARKPEPEFTLKTTRAGTLTVRGKTYPDDPTLRLYRRGEHIFTIVAAGRSDCLRLVGWMEGFQIPISGARYPTAGMFLDVVSMERLLQSIFPARPAAAEAVAIPATPLQSPQQAQAGAA